MANTRSMIRNHASLSSSKNWCKTSDKGDEGPWSDVNHDVLVLVIMQLGVVDFVAFSGVCKSWRSFALSQRNMFMGSKPPMSMCIKSHANEEYYYCHLEDHEGRKLKTVIPHSAGRSCYGLTCGYLIMCGKKTRDFWLVNPVTRHELHFPDFPFDIGDNSEIKAILVFSPSISGWVFVVFHRKISFRTTCKRKISFSIAGKRRWNHVSASLPIHDLHVFNGKIYTLHTDFSLGELELNLKQKQKHKWTLLETKSFPDTDFYHPCLVSLSENLYMITRFSITKKVMELDFGEMKWVSPKKTTTELAFFISNLYPSAAIKQKSWAAPQTQYKSTDESRQHMFYYSWIWYFPHDCLNVNLLNE